MRRLTAILITLALSTGACNGSSTTTPTTGTSSSKTMTAVIDGSAWTAVSVTGSRANSVISIAGNDSASPARSIALSVIGASAGTYAVSSGAANAMVEIGSGQSWSANAVGGSGTITFTALSTTGATGTFSFTAIPAGGGAAGTRVVTSGAFNVTF